MSENDNLSVAVLTPELVKNNISIQLKKVELSIQKLHDTEAELVYNEDNLQKIADFIIEAKKAEGIIEEERVNLKKDPLERGRVIDEGAKLISGDITALKKKAHDKYTALCLEVQRKINEANAAKAEKERISKLVNTTLFDYSEKIANALTYKEVLETERLLNLETANKVKYGDQLEDLQARTKGIRNLIAAQKVNLKDLSVLEQKEQELTESGNDVALSEVLEKKAAINGKIFNNSLKLQETASDQARETKNEEATQLFPEVNAKRTVWAFEVVDLQLLLKKKPELISITPDEKAIKNFLNHRKIDGLLKEETIDGLRVYKKQTF